MKVTVFYDYNCPFCFLGIKRLELLEREFPLEVNSKGIEIHPEIPPCGIKRSNTLKRKYLAQNLEQLYEEDSLELKLPGVIANSRLSLEASEFAKTKNKFRDFHLGIYKAYFQEGENIGEPDVIFKVGQESGLQLYELNECLIKRTMLEKIEDNRKEAESHQVFGVPTFIFDKFLVHGVQSLESFRSILTKAIGRQQASS
jgi:predicted DsbA family dithiol-disulfide isomerase